MVAPRLLDLFSGIGGFSLGLERAGFETVTSSKPSRIRWDRVAAVSFCGMVWMAPFACARAGEVCQAPQVVAVFRCDDARAIDGDSLECKSGQRVRSWGFDSPERGSPGFAEAKAAMASLTRGETIKCEEFYKDRYRRSVAMCYTSKGDLGRQLVSLGVVKDYPKYSAGFYGPACWGDWK